MVISMALIPKKLPATTYQLQSGFSLVEVILSSSIFALVTVAFVGVFLYGQQSTVLAGSRLRAAFLAEEGLEAVRNLRDESFANLAPGTHGLAVSGGQWAFSGSQDVTDVFTRQIVISSIDADTREITSSVSWQQTPQRSGLAELVTRLTNWMAAVSAVPRFESFATSLDNQGNTLVIGKPAGTQAGDLLIACIGFEKGSQPSITAPSGWTLIRRVNSGTNNGGACYHKIATASEPASYSWQFTAGPKRAGGIARYSGASATAPIHVSAGAASSSQSDQHTAPSVTTTLDNARVIVYYTSKKSCAYTPAAGTEERWDVPNTAGGLPSNMLADFEQAGAGATGAKTATCTEPEVWQAITIAIVP